MNLLLMTCFSTTNEVESEGREPNSLEVMTEMTYCGENGFLFSLALV